MDYNTTMQLCICDRAAVGELNTEYSMPDYKPEIKRLLRVGVTLMPPAAYAGAGNAEMSGTARFDILYSAPDGMLYSDCVSETYDLSVPFDKEASVDMNDEIVILPSLRPETVVCRVLAPRKLSIRLRYGAKVRAYGRHAIEEELHGMANGIQRLTDEVMSGAFAKSEVHRFDLSEAVPAEGEGVRVVAADVQMCVTDAEVSGGMIGCRGHATVKLLLCQDEEGTPYAVTRKIPFTENLSGEGFRDGMACVARAVCEEIRTEVEDGKVLCDIVGHIEAMGGENRATAYTKDIFSTENVSREEYQTVEYPTLIGTVGGNFTQSLYEPVESYGISPDATVIDISVRPQADAVTYERGKWALAGDSTVNLLLKNGDEYTTQELSMPFRYEFDGSEGEARAAIANVNMMSGKARVDGGRLGIDCEMGVSLMLCGADSVQMLSEATFGDPTERPCECVICFPREGESLWNVAKKYHVSPDALRKLNKGVGDILGGKFLIVNE